MHFTSINDYKDICIIGVIDDSQVLPRWCRWYLPVILHNFSSVNDPGNASSIGVKGIGSGGAAGVVEAVMHHKNLGQFGRAFKGTSSKKQAISRDYFQVA